mgnify:CR=1 FL=1
MSMKIITPLAALIIAANVWAIAPAVDSEYDSKQASAINHKFDNLDNQADLDDVTYQASEKAKTIKAANESLKRIKG